MTCRAEPAFKPASRKALGITIVFLTGFVRPMADASALDDTFTIAVVPDTQFYVDYSHQTEAGFPFNARELFFQQMQFVADHSVANGGEIAFLTAVGDVWEHQSTEMDPEHAARGMKRVPNALLDDVIAPRRETRSVEMPIARRGYEMIAGKIPFSVAPGNHDFDAVWTDSRYPVPPEAERARSAFPRGGIHGGGLTNFKHVFGKDSPFFKGKHWYVASSNGGANSAQVFEGGGYRFLHLGLEMSPSNPVIDWAGKVLRNYPGLPTIISTHDYLNVKGERKALNLPDMKAVDPDAHNNAEELWQKLIERHDQIFLVLCGHQNGQSYRVDSNQHGHEVYQLLADYQGRRQTAVEANAVVQFGVGDGWLRLLEFDLSAEAPRLHVRTYSTYYKAYSSELPTYARWYKEREHPELDDAAYLALDDFAIPLKDFRDRFSQARVGQAPR